MAGINLKITQEAYGTDSKAWMKSQYGFDTARPCTLLLTAFAATEQINGMIPSGVLVGKITASGLYGPYDNAAATGVEVAAGILLNEVRITRDANDTPALDRAASAFVWQGIVDTTKLPALTGTKGKLDTPGRADLPGIRWEP